MISRVHGVGPLDDDGRLTHLVARVDGFRALGRGGGVALLLRGGGRCRVRKQERDAEDEEEAAAEVSQG